jgi:hypothetical protein
MKTEKNLLALFLVCVVFFIMDGFLAHGQPAIPLSVGFWYPTNGETYTAPANIGLHAQVADSVVVETVQYFSGTTNIGIVTNKNGVLVTNLNTDSPFYLLWSNVAAGSYKLTAVATDSNGVVVTSSPVTISVVAPVVRPSIYIPFPTNNSVFHGPTNLTLYARAVESGGTIASVQFFAGSNSLGIVTNGPGVQVTNLSIEPEPLFPLTWSNVPLGNFVLTAVAVDGVGNSSTSSVVNISVVTNPPPMPFTISFYYPTNGESYLAPATVAVHALVLDSNVVETVQYFANGTNIGIRTNSSGILLTNSSAGNPFELNWSNVLAGAYALTAVATDGKGIMVTSLPVNITVTNPPPPPPIPFTVSFYYPTNGEFYLAPATVGVHALVLDSNIVETVQYFANGTNIGVRTNSSGILLTNSSTGNPFELNWSNVLAGAYALTAVATDAKGIMVTSSPVNITVTNPPPPPPVPFTISFYYPTNGEFYLAPATIGVHALVLDSNIVETVQYFANGTNIGVRTNSSGILLTNSTTANPFFLAWSNVPAGNYALIAVATDAKGIMVTSSPVNITVTNPPPPPPVPFTISFYYPTNGEFYLAPATIGVHALVLDSNIVETVQYFANGTNIGIRTNSSGILLTNSSTPNPFFLAWSNVPVGTYSLIAVATDASGATATSAPVNIIVVSNLPPTVSIYAPDPVAVEGTNLISFTPTNGFTNYCSGSNTATFLVLRNGATNVDLAVDYSIGGTASNGVDYATIPDQVTILAGQRYALITIVPLNDNDTNRPYDTVVLTLTVPPYPTNTLPPYLIGSPGKAGAIILENGSLPILQPLARLLIDGSVHTSLPGTNGMNFCVQVSTDLVNWLPICTNTILKGSAQFVDPDATASPKLFYRAVFVPAPPSY